MANTKRTMTPSGSSPDWTRIFIDNPELDPPDYYEASERAEQRSEARRERNGERSKKKR